MIMETTCNWIIRSCGCIIVCLFILVQSTSAQPGFVSIACCAESEATVRNGMNYTSDNGLFRVGTSCRDLTSTTANDTGNFKVRNFYVSSGKICYSLPTTKGRAYLLRGFFINDDFQISASTTAFDVLIGVTPISVVIPSRSLEAVEGIFRATNQNVDFCLVHRLGDPYISQLELRPLNESKYLQGNASSVLKVISRIDVGNPGDSIRYPDDAFDRIWRSPDSETVSPSASITNTSVLITNTTIPSNVLQTALTHTDRLEFLHGDLGMDDNNYTLFLYFYELNDTVKMGERVFNVYINNEIMLDKFDILTNGSKYAEASMSVRANQTLNLTLVRVRNGSDFGPTLNAYEILKMQTWFQGSNQQDVDLMATVRGELLQQNKESEVLQSWSGDPCLPTPWEGLACDKDGGSSVISRLDVSSSLLRGPLPASIPKLSYLKELNLSHNDFTDKIPPFPPSSVLISVDLSHNDFMGFLPNSLLLLSKLTLLYYGCNPHFGKELPPSFSRSKLVTDYGTCSGQGSSRRSNGAFIGSIACGSFLVAIGITIVTVYGIKSRGKGKFGGKKQYRITKNAVFSVHSREDIVVKSISIQMYTLDCIENSTQKYKTLIGEGGFGSVYRGILPDGQEVAVKVRSSTSTQGTREFENELNLLSSIRHENLVPLLGYCCENDQQILVYPFMSNGSLQDRLYGEAAKRKILDWPTRLSIALGAARGLTYLHTFAGRCVIHRDIKSSNILLDHSMNAKVADFGFSKYAPQEGDSGASLEVRGTAGYLDPEYYSTKHLSAKSDVFSFGVVLLEIVSGREPLNIHRPRNEWSLVEWAKTYIRESKIDEIVDPNVKGGYHVEAMWRVVEAALACTEPFSAYRPCMADIVRELEDALIIETNASEYMKSIDSLGGSNRFSIVLDKKITVPQPDPTPPEPSPINTQALAPPEPR